jgi:RHS repeat-associated protein
MLANYFPLALFAPVKVKALEKEVIHENVIEEKKPEILNEIIEKRAVNEKHFLMTDGTIMAMVYPDSVHYLKENKLHDIDNSLIDNGKTYSNKNNDFSVSFEKNIQTNRIFTINSDGYTVGLSLFGINKVKGEVKKGFISKDKFELKNLTSAIEYNNFMNDSSIVYDILPNGVKESIILNSKKSLSNNFNFEINTTLLAKVKNRNTIILYDGKTKKEIFKVSAPFMFDAKGEYNDNINLVIQKTKVGYKVNMKLDMAWLNNKDRVYPIVIDPTITTSRDFNHIQDTFIFSGDADNTTRHNAHILRVGNHTYSSPSAIRSLIKFTLPTLNTGDQIVDADFRIYNYQDDAYWNPPTTSIRVDIHKMTKNWVDSTAQWADLYTSFDPRIVDYFTYKYETTNVNKENYANITSIVQDWYTTGNNFGIMLKESVEGPVTGRNDMSFLSVNVSASTYYYKRPVIRITYRNQSGLESYQTYSTQKIGRAGSTHVNNYNGNLVYTHVDTATIGERMPINIGHVYNSNDRSTNIGFGFGYRLNLSQRFQFVTIGGIQYIKYIDEDATTHYFYKDGTVYKDEDGLGTQFVATSTGYTMTDKSGTKYNFVKYDTFYHLKQIVNPSGNKITLNYSGSLITSVVDGGGQAVYLYYTNGLLSSIKDVSGKYIYYTYTNKQLTSIKYVDGLIAYITYNTNNLITSIKNIDNSKLTYEYYPAAPYRVKKVTETGTAGTIGVALTFAYGKNYTTILDNKNYLQNYIFNNFGQTTSISDIGSGVDMNNVYGTSYKYLNTSNVIRNKLQLETPLRGVVNNYVKNGSAERDLNDWTISNESVSLGTFIITTESAYLGHKSFKLNSTNSSIIVYGIQQNSSILTNKTYTLSAYAKLNNVIASSNNGAVLYFTYVDALGKSVTNYSAPLSGTKDFAKQILTVSVPTGATNIRYGFGLKSATGTVYYDAIQLEEGTASNDYNLIENNHFYYDGINWIGTSLSANDKVISLNGNKAFQLTGGARRNTYQNVHVKGLKGDSFNISFWAKARSKPIYGDAAVDVRINIVSNDNVAQWITVTINPDSKEWQYVSDEIIANHDYKRIDVYLCYYNNVHEVYFDNIMLFKDAKGSSYTYDSLGNIVKSTAGTSTSTLMQYDTKNQLTKFSPSTTNNYTFEYNANIKNQLLRATSNDGLSLTLNYDAYGNKIKSTIKNINGLEYIETGNTYSTNGNRKLTESSILGKMTYVYNTNGTLQKKTDAKGNATTYIYDNLYRTKTITNNGITKQYDFANDKISKITHNGFSYNINYDEFGNLTKMNIGSQNIITNNYIANNGLLSNSTFANGGIVKYSYNKFGQISRLEKNDNAYDYVYSAKGEISSIKDKTNTSYYVYDISGRLLDEIATNGYSTSYKYGSNGKITNLNYSLNQLKNEVEVKYGQYDRAESINYNNYQILYKYDLLARVNQQTIKSGANIFNIDYGYLTNSNRTSFLLNNIKLGNNQYRYTYDANGNVETVSLNGVELSRYYYDSINQLVKEDSKLENKTITYTYDSGSNLTLKTEYKYKTTELIKKITYGYDAVWKDKLVSYNGIQITYDAIGNPLSYNGNNYTWINGKELARIVSTGKDYKYQYNQDGIRTQKNINGVITNYYLSGMNVIYEKTNNDIINYNYDINNSLSGFTYNSAQYYYLKNLQNDIIGILDSNLKQIVAYEYDSWGKHISIKDNLGNDLSKNTSHIANINPYRYRSYRYDQETGMYYLNARYYNPEWKRFINSDDIIAANNDTSSFNLFTYSSNNPINYVDKTGNFAIALALQGLGLLEIIKFVTILAITYIASKAIVDTLAPPIAQVITDTIDNIRPELTDKNHSIYFLKQGNKIVYVGRTVDVVRREREHKLNPVRGHLKFHVQHTSLNMIQARVAEQIYIVHFSMINKYGKASNRINSIAMLNPMYDFYVAPAMAAIQTLSDESLIYTGG